MNDPQIPQRNSTFENIKQILAKYRQTLLVALALVLCIGISWAYLTYLATPVLNRFTFGKPEVNIEEEFNGWGEQNKKVKVTNPDNGGNVPVVVRMTFVITFTDTQTGKSVTKEIKPLTSPNGTVVDIGDFLLHFDTNWANSWFFQKGYFYLNRILPPGGESPDLLAGITLKNDTAEKRQEYQNIEVTLIVYTDVIQAEGGGAEDNWSVEVNGNIVSPKSP